MNNRIISILIVALVTLSSNAYAWWNKDWDYRKEFNLDTTATGLPIEATLNETAVLVKLHLGNFTYFADTLPAGEDIRFIAGDDITPLKHHIEYFDPLQQIGLIWVKLPRLTPATNLEKIYMYYGNSSAVSGEDKPATFGVDDVLVYHFDGMAEDATAYMNNPQINTAIEAPGAAIGAGVEFTGTESITIASTPSLRLVPETGATVSLWTKIINEQDNATVFSYTEDNGDVISLKINDTNPYVEYISNGITTATPILAESELTLDTWNHLAFTVSAENIILYVNGLETAIMELPIVEMGGVLTLAAAADGSQAFIGQIDQLHIVKRAVTLDWISLAYTNQGPSDLLVVAGADGQQEGAGGGHNPLAFSLSKLTLEGKITTGTLMVMLLYGLYIMFAKGMFIGRVKKSNNLFAERFASEATDLVATQTDLDVDDKALGSSTLNGIYKVAMKELLARLELTPSLSVNSISSIRSATDTIILRQTQRLNSQMVLLTIAIAGGPFIGLLGTVMGVMITFADVALAGNVDVNAIAPGISAALVATVAGLLVAIPCLFGYNYLAAQIKEIVADMRVFADEFQAKITEQYGE